MPSRPFPRLAAALSLVAGLLAAGPTAADEARVRAALASARLPPGFRLTLFAMVPGARHMAVSPDGRTLVVGSTGTAIHRLTLRPGAAPEVARLAPQTAFDMPNGPCFAPDGALFVAERNRILRFDPVPGGGLDEARPVPIVAAGDLIPKAEESRNHSARVCRIGPDGRLYVAIGQPYNVPPAGKLALYDRIGMGGIVRFDRDGGDREVFARGLRNSVGLDFDPTDGVLWFTDNQVDLMGDDIPPGEIDRAPRAGLHFGFPWYGGGRVRTRDYAGETPPADVVFPEVEEVAHAADLGLVFHRATAFPAEWRGLFSAQHGSWNRSQPVGARVMFTAVEAGRAAPSKPFLEGWNPGRGGYLARPVDVAALPDGSLIVSDDLNGALWRIAPEAR